MRTRTKSVEEATLRQERDPSVSLLIQKRFLDQRKIFLWGPITDETAKDLSEKLLYLESTAPGKEITFYMNTPGGSITAGMAVFDTMKLVSSPITVVVTGMAASMGSILLCAAAKGRRLHLSARRACSSTSRSSPAGSSGRRPTSTSRRRRWRSFAAS